MKRVDHSYQANPIKSTNIINNSNSGSNAKINKNQHYSIARERSVRPSCFSSDEERENCFVAIGFYTVHDVRI